MAWRNIAENVVEGFAGAAGADDVVNRIEYDKQLERQNAAREQSFKMAPYVQELNGLNAKVAPMLDASGQPKKGMEKAYNQIHTQYLDTIQKMRDIMHPQHVGASPMDRLKMRMADAMHLGNWHKQIASKIKARDMQNALADKEENQSVARAYEAGVVPQANPYIANRDQMKEAGFSDQDIQQANAIRAGIEAKPVATRDAYDIISGVVDGHQVTFQRNKGDASDLRDMAGNPVSPEIAAQFVAAPKGVSGSDFWKRVTSQFGPNPTAEQIDAARRQWAIDSAHGTATSGYSSTDAAGNTTTHASRVPVFAGGSSVPSAHASTPASSSQAPSTASAASGAATAHKVAPGASGGAVAPHSGHTAYSSGTKPPTHTSAPASGGGASGIDKDIDAVGTYQIPIEKASSAKGGSRQKFLELVMEKYPNYDSTLFEAKAQARKAFTAGGIEAKNIKSLGTAIGHLGSLYNSIVALNNSSIPLLNEGRNGFLKNVAGSPKPTDVETYASAVSGEMATVFKNSSGTDQEISEWRHNINRNGSLQQQMSAARDMAELMSSRMEREVQMYQGSFGTLKGFPTLDNHQRLVLMKVGGEGSRRMLAIDSMVQKANASKTPSQGGQGNHGDDLLKRLREATGAK